MTNTPNINYRLLKSWISDARTEEVLADLEKKLAKEPAYKAYLNEVILLSSSYSTLERGRRIDILNFQNYNTKVNQINDALLSLMDDLEEGKELTRSRAKIPMYPYWKMVMPLFMLMMILLGLAGGAAYYFLQNKDTSPPIEAEKWTCPTFKKGQFKVLILPFQNDPLPGRTAPYQLIAERLNDFCKEEGLKAQIGRIQSDEVINAVTNQDEAAAYIAKCDPNMLIWGQATVVENTTALTINYSIINPSDFEYLSDFELEGGKDTLLKDALFPSTYKGTTQEIEAVLKNLLKVTVAFSNKDYPAVIKNIETTAVASALESSKATQMWKNLAGAESYTKTNQIEKAIASYTEVLAVEPTSKFALNNRAHLNLQQEHLDEALADFNTMETLEKADYETFYKKAEIQEKLGNLGAAKEDYSRAKSVSPLKVQERIDSQLKKVDKQIEVEKKKISNTEKPISSLPNTTKKTPNSGKNQRPKNLNQLIEEAKIHNKIGANKAAEVAIMDVLKKSPKNKKAIKELIRSKYFQNNAIDITELQDNPYLKNIDSAALMQLKDPVLNSIIRNERLNKQGKKRRKKKK